MPRKNLVIIFVIPVLSGFFLTGCGDSDELNNLRSKVESLEGDVRLERNRNEDLEKRFDTSQRELAKMKLQLQDSQSDRDKLNESLKKLDKEFSDYKQKYKVSISKKIPGLQLPDVTINKKTYKGLVVSRLDDESVSCNTPEGIVRIKRDEMPADLAAMLAMDQKTDFQTQIPVVLRLVQDHIDGKTSTTELSSGIHGQYRQYADVLQSVALLKCQQDGGTYAGTGFLAKQNGVTYFFTNAHMVSGKNLKAQIVMGPDNIVPLNLPKEMEVSEEEEADDVVRFEMPDCKIPALQIADKDSKLMPDQFIMALGNSEGAGVIPCIKGRTGGIGIYWVEIDAPVTHGNSGGPVVLDGGKTVVGVVTKYERALGDHTTLPGSSSTGIRRLCIRPERVGKWRRVPVEQIVKEAEAIRRVVTDTRILETLEGFYIRAQSGYSLYSTRYERPDEFYVFKDTELGASLAHYIHLLEANLKDDKMKFDAKKDFWLRADRVTADIRNDSLGRELKASQKKVRDHVALFMDSVAALYQVGISDVDGKDYCAYDRKMFKEAAKDREKVVDVLRKHFAEEIRQFEFDAS